MLMQSPRVCEASLTVFLSRQSAATSESELGPAAGVAWRRVWCRGGRQAGRQARGASHAHTRTLTRSLAGSGAAATWHAAQTVAAVAPARTTALPHSTCPLDFALSTRSQAWLPGIQTPERRGAAALPNSAPEVAPSRAF
jgi:hypothetical protein